MTLNEDTRFRYLAETSRVLRNAGFDVEPQTDGSLSVGFEGNPLCNVVNPGGITYRSENLTTPQLEQAKDQAFEAVKLTAEYMKAYDQGQPLKAAGLVNGYRAIADYNGTVLAAAESHLGMQFVTWDWDFNRAGVSHGHYFGGNYEGAKQDFATRSQLIDHNRLFTPEQTIEIYRCCADALNYGLDLTYGRDDTWLRYSASSCLTVRTDLQSSPCLQLTTSFWTRWINFSSSPVQVLSGKSTNTPTSSTLRCL